MAECIFNGLAAAFAIAAGALWWTSAVVKVRAGKRPNNPDGFQSQSIYVGSGEQQYELVETITRQSKWSAGAAMAASGAAFCQALALILK